MGPPGVGKGTQAERLRDHLSIPHVSTGDMFRALDDTTDLGRRVKEIMESGAYVPDSIVIEMLQERLRKKRKIRSKKRTQGSILRLQFAFGDPDVGFGRLQRVGNPTEWF